MRTMSSLFIYFLVYAYINIDLDEKIIENIDDNFYLFYFKNKILFEFVLILNLNIPYKENSIIKLFLVQNM